jgi:hypothetical protein
MLLKSIHKHWMTLLSFLQIDRVRLAVVTDATDVVSGFGLDVAVFAYTEKADAAFVNRAVSIKFFVTRMTRGIMEKKAVPASRRLGRVFRREEGGSRSDLLTSQEGKGTAEASRAVAAE